MAGTTQDGKQEAEKPEAGEQESGKQAGEAVEPRSGGGLGVGSEEEAAKPGGLRRPTLRDVVFSCKTFLAAAICLTIGFRFQLENPYWSALTCYVISNPPGAGAIRTKSLFRLGGTVVGAGIVLVLTGLFADQIGVLASAYIMVVTIVGYLFLVDRTPMNYVYLAICITIAVLGVTRLQTPENVFDISMTRTMEICIGIIVMFIVDSIIMPEPQTPKFLKEAGKWRRTARDWLVDAVGSDVGVAADADKRKRIRDRMKQLMGGLSAIDGQAVQLPFDSPDRPPRGYHLDLLRHELTALTADIAGLELWLRGFERDASPHRALLQAQGSDVAAWLRAAPADPCATTLDGHIAQGEALIGQIEHARETIDGGEGRTAIIASGVLSRIASAVRHWCDLSLAMRAIATGRPQTPRLEAIGRAARPVRSVDYLAKAIDIVPMILAMSFTLALWYWTAWSGAIGAMVLALISTLFLVGLPVGKGVAGMVIGFFLSGCFVFVYQFALLPRATTMEMLLLALACGLIPMGILMAQNPLGLILSASTVAILALQNGYQADVVQTLITVLSIMVGACIGGAALYLCSYDRARFTLRRLVAAARGDNRDLARAKRLPPRDRLTSLSLYRLSLGITAADQLGDDAPSKTPALLHELGVGASLLSLRQLEPLTAPPAAEVIRSIRDIVAREREGRLPDPQGDDALCAMLAQSIEDPAIVDDPVGVRLREALVGLDLTLRELPSRSLAGAQP